MGLGEMTFEEILFHGRYHIIGGVLFLIFFGVFIHEAIKEMIAVRARRGHALRRVAVGPLMHDALVGQTMTDGGEPVGESEDEKEAG